uniref:Purkinje cell protein 2 homolog isoform X1 n=2 Tax=Pristiophorus japonicus TaxID=55135 RepID=UPI00398E70BF
MALFRRRAENEGFFKMVSHAQRNRMDDQRCDLGQNETPSGKSTIIERNKSSHERPINELLDLLADKQGQRLDDQRVTCDNLPGLQLSKCSMQSTDAEIETE